MTHIYRDFRALDTLSPSQEQELVLLEKQFLMESDKQHVLLSSGFSMPLVCDSWVAHILSTPN